MPSVQEIRELIQKVGIGPEDESFLPRLVRLIEGKRGWRSRLEELIARPHAALSARIESGGLQLGASAKSRLRGHELAQILIDAHGELDLDALSGAISALQANLFSLASDGVYDAERQRHLLKILLLLRDDPRLMRRLKAITPPLGNTLADEFIRATLELPASSKIDKACVRRAVLSASLTYLRQNVGSCFATAPAILIHTEQPAAFLEDMDALLSTGQLKRTFGGVEHVVPLCHSSGLGDLLRPFLLEKEYPLLPSCYGLQKGCIAAGLILPGLQERERRSALLPLLRRAITHLRHQRITITNARELFKTLLLLEGDLTEEDVAHERDLEPRKEIETYHKRLNAAMQAFKGVTDNPLLKAWEFSLASFSDVKANLSRWNLYSSLGLQADETGGIGEVITDSLQVRLDTANRAAEELRTHYESEWGGLKFLEARLRSVSEDEARWLRTEYNAKVGSLRSLEIEYNEAQETAHLLARLFPRMAELYNTLFLDYFQEVYDPEMADITPSAYDDSPAGFRLLFKHGRTNPALWTLIHTPSEFIDALAEFFIAAERSLLAEPDLQPLSNTIGTLTTAIINHIRTATFLETALQRMGRAHGSAPTSNPLVNLTRIEKKPWAYISGGTMTTLVSIYFHREEKPTLRERCVESPTDLLIFLLDTMKELPAATTDPYLSDPTRSMLIQSPTHGFLFKPGLSPFKEGWLDRGNTSTWIRERLVYPSQTLLDEIEIDEPSFQAILHHLSLTLPHALRDSLIHLPRRLIRGSMPPQEVRKTLLSLFESHHFWRNASNTLLPSSAIDSALYSLIPFVPQNSLRRETFSILEHLLREEPKILHLAMEAFDLAAGQRRSHLPLSSLALQRLIHSLYLLASGRLSSPRDIQWEIRALLRRKKLALPAPLLFADTNWAKEYFAFIVNPSDATLGLWRTDYLGLAATPMDEWRQWLSGPQTIPWAVYVNPSEYVATDQRGAPPPLGAQLV